MLTFTPFLYDDFDINISIPKHRYVPKLKSEDKTKDSSKPVQSDIEEIRELEKEEDQKKNINTTPTFTGTGFNQFSQAYLASGVDRSKFNFFAKLAQKESGFNYQIQNQFGAPAYGYFQFMQDGKKWNNIQAYANTDIQSFRNDPILQIQAADRLANAFLSGFNQKDLDRAKELGYSKSALIAGAWLGGVGGVRKLLHEGKSINDFAWSKDKKSGADMKSRMDEFNNMFKRGGVIKMAKGGSEWVPEWYEGRSTIADSNLDSVTVSPFVKGAGVKKLLKNLSIAREIIDPSKVTPGSLGTYYPSSHKIYLKEEDPSTSVHEWTHASNPWVQKQIIDEIKDSMGDAIFDQSYIQNDEYLDSSSEIYARLMQLRHHLGVDPGHVFTEDEIEKLKQDSIKSKTLMHIYNDSVAETKFDNKNNVIKTDDVKIGEKPQDSKVFYEYNEEGVFDILNRYSTKFITRLLNEVASSKTLPEGVAYAQNGMQFVPPMLRRNNANYNYRLGTYDADSGHWSSRDPESGLELKRPSHTTHFLHAESEKLLGNKRYEDVNGNYYTFEDFNLTPFIYGYQPVPFPKYNQERTHQAQIANNPRTKYIYDKLIEGKLNHNQAIGIMANMWMESKFDPQAHSGKYQGLLQLSPSLWKNYEEWLAKNNLTGTTEDQLNYLIPIITSRDKANPHNLTNQNIFINEWGGYGRQDKFLNSHISPEDSAELFATLFERQGAEDMHKRRKWASLLNNIINASK